MTDGHVTNPAARATKGRRKNLNRIWNTKDHKARVKAFCGGKVCAWCGASEGLTAHHPYLESYAGCYTDLELSGCIVLCNRCHFSLHKGLVLCQLCKKHYHRVGAEMCKECFFKAHPDIVKARELMIAEQAARIKAAKKAAADKRKAAKARHRCGAYRVGGICGKSSIGSRCPHAPTKAVRNCADFEAKKGVPA